MPKSLSLSLSGPSPDHKWELAATSSSTGVGLSRFVENKKGSTIIFSILPIYYAVFSTC